MSDSGVAVVATSMSARSLSRRHHSGTGTPAMVLVVSGSADLKLSAVGEERSVDMSDWTSGRVNTGAAEGRPVNRLSKSFADCPPARFPAEGGAWPVPLRAPVPMIEIIDKKEARNSRRRSAQEKVEAFTRAGCR